MVDSYPTYSISLFILRFSPMMSDFLLKVVLLEIWVIYGEGVEVALALKFATTFILDSILV
jgi:hypothetical protein